LLHRAYAPLAARGMRFLASHQDENKTRERIESGECHVAVLRNSGRIIGTVVFVPPWAPSDGDYYRQPHVAWFQQFAVEPEFQGRGIGGLLLDVVERRAAKTGAAEVALDTSEHATGLIALYRRRGYEVVARESWDVTNYASVIMRKPIRSS
jgi:GNAT superfamily N-acetyltransferase